MDASLQVSYDSEDEPPIDDPVCIARVPIRKCVQPYV